MTPPPIGTSERPLGVIGTFLAILVAFILSQVVVAGLMIAVLIVFAIADGASARALVEGGAENLTSNPAVLGISTVGTGMTLVLTAYASLRIVKAPVLPSLGLTRARALHVMLGVVMLALTIPLADAATQLLRYLLPNFTLGVLEGIGDAARSPSVPLVVVLFTGIAVVAPIAEEIFFRGLVQRSLVGRLGPVGGVALASFLFGAFHIDPPQALGAGVLGTILGVVTWRTKSLVPAMVAHAFNNALALTASRYAEGGPPEIDMATRLPLLGVTLPLLAAATWLLWRGSPSATRERPAP